VGNVEVEFHTRLNYQLKIDHYNYKIFYVCPLPATNKTSIGDTRRRRKQSKNVNTTKSMKQKGRQQEMKGGTK
jgi:hypothetical protein